MSRQNDPFEEFEFKPLTDGLGFHKKAVHLKEEVGAADLARSLRKTDIPDLTDLLFDEPDEELARPKYSSSAKLTQRNPNLVENDYLKKMANTPDKFAAPKIENIELTVPLEKVEIKKPLPRAEDTMARKSEPTARIEPKLRLDFAETDLKTPNLDKAILQVKEENRYKKVPTAMFASIFDSVVAFTLAIVFMVAMMMVVEVDLLAMVLNAETQMLAQISFGALYLSVLSLYMVMSRSVATKTLGEWAFDIHLAQKNGQRSAIFPLLVIWRSLLMIGTGLVTLPLLSLLCRRDLASYLTGTQLYQLK